MKKQFVLIDDDSISNVITKACITKTFTDADVKAFIDPKVAISYINTDPELNEPGAGITVLMDMNMPVMTGFETLDEFEKLAEEVKNRLEIYVLSASVYPDEIEKTKKYSWVKGFIEKPLSIPKVMDRLMHPPC